jgi:hypothetical protein
MFTKEPIESHIRGMKVNKPVEKRTNCNLLKQELVKEGTSHLLKKKLVEKIPISPILVQINDVSINLITGVSFLEKVCLKGHIVFQALPLLISWL